MKGRYIFNHITPSALQQRTDINDALCQGMDGWPGEESRHNPYVGPRDRQIVRPDYRRVQVVLGNLGRLFGWG